MGQIDWNLKRTFDSPEGVIRWDSFGDGPPIVLLHGTPNWSFIWRDVVGHLRDRHRVFVFDWPGFGRSDRYPGQNISWDEQARRLPELFAQWEIVTPTVVAFDFAPIFALRAHFFEGLDVGAFVLADAAVVPPFVTDFSRQVRDNIQTMSQLPVYVAEAMIEAHLRSTTHRPMERDALDAYMSPWRGEDGVAAYWRAVARYDEDMAAPLRSRLPNLTVPTRLVWGERDAWIPPQKAHELAAVLPNAEVRFIPNAGHFSPEDDPEAFARAILEFEAELGR